MEKEMYFAGDLELEIEEIRKMDEKDDEVVRVSFSTVCSPLLTLICC